VQDIAQDINGSWPQSNLRYRCT